MHITVDIRPPDDTLLQYILKISQLQYKVCDLQIKLLASSQLKLAIEPAGYILILVSQYNHELAILSNRTIKCGLLCQAYKIDLES